MKIYKLRAWTNKTIKRGRHKGTMEHTYSFEEIIVDNLETAKLSFQQQVKQVKCEMGYADNGHIELFEPHVFDNGLLAYWPDDDKYIDRRETP